MYVGNFERMRVRKCCIIIRLRPKTVAKKYEAFQFYIRLILYLCNPYCNLLINVYKNKSFK